MNTITGLIVTYTSVCIPGDECIRIMREASLWPGTDGPRDLHIDRLNQNTEVRIESKTHIQLSSDLSWNGNRPHIVTVGCNKTSTLVQQGAILEYRQPEKQTATTDTVNKYILEAQLHVKGKYVHLGYMYPMFNTESEAAEFHINHYPHLTAMTAKSGWKSDYCPHDNVRYIIRVHNDEALTLNMYNVAEAAEEEMNRQNSC